MGSSGIETLLNMVSENTKLRECEPGDPEYHAFIEELGMLVAASMTMGMDKLSRIGLNSELAFDLLLRGVATLIASNISAEPSLIDDEHSLHEVQKYMAGAAMCMIGLLEVDMSEVIPLDTTTPNALRFFISGFVDDGMYEEFLTTCSSACSKLWLVDKVKGSLTVAFEKQLREFHIYPTDGYKPCPDEVAILVIRNIGGIPDGPLSEDDYASATESTKAVLRTQTSKESLQSAIRIADGVSRHGRGE